MTYNDQSVFRNWMSRKWLSQNWGLHSTCTTSSSTSWSRYVTRLHKSWTHYITCVWDSSFLLKKNNKECTSWTHYFLVETHQNFIPQGSLMIHVCNLLYIVISIFMVKNHLMVFFQDRVLIWVWKLLWYIKICRK